MEKRDITLRASSEELIKKFRDKIEEIVVLNGGNNGWNDHQRNIAEDIEDAEIYIMTKMDDVMAYLKAVKSLY